MELIDVTPKRDDQIHWEEYKDRYSESCPHFLHKGKLYAFYDDYVGTDIYTGETECFGSEFITPVEIVSLKYVVRTEHL